MADDDLETDDQVAAPAAPAASAPAPSPAPSQSSPSGGTVIGPGNPKFNPAWNSGKPYSSSFQVGVSPSSKSTQPSVDQGLETDEQVGGKPGPQDKGILANTGKESWASGAVKGLVTAAINAPADIAGMPGSLRHLGDYLWAKGESAITGEPAEKILARHQQQIQQASPLGGAAEIDRDDIAAPVLNRTGAYKPSTEIGKMAQTGAELAMSGAIPGGAAGKLPTVGRALSDVGVGAASQGATDATGSPLAGLAVGVAGGPAASKIGQGIKKPAQYFHAGMPDWVPGAQGAREARAGQQLIANSTNPDQVMNTPASTNTDLGPETLGEQTGDPKLLEKQRQFTNTATPQTAGFRQTAVAQNTALQNKLNSLAPGGDQIAPSQRFQENYDGIEQAGQDAENRLRANAQRYAQQGLGPNLSAEDRATADVGRGDVIRNGIQTIRNEVAQRRGALFDAVDPDGTLNVIASGARQRGDDIANSAGQFAGPLSEDAIRLTEKVQNLPDVMRFGDLRDVEQDITGSMGKERRQNGETPSWRRMSQLKGAVVDARNRALDNQAAREAQLAAEGRSPGDEPTQSRMAAWERANGFERANARVSEGEAGPGLQGSRSVSGQEAGGSGRAAPGVVSPLRGTGQGSGRAAGSEAVPEGAGQENARAPLTGAEYVARNGGLDPQTAKDYGIPQSKTSRGYVIRKGGRKLDDMATKMSEDGYLNRQDNNLLDRDLVSEMHDVLDKEIGHGQPTYSTNDREAVEAMQDRQTRAANAESRTQAMRAASDSVQQAVKEHGFQNMSDADIRQAAGMVMKGQDPADALASIEEGRSARAGEESASPPNRYEGPEPEPETPAPKGRAKATPASTYPELEPNFTPEANARQTRANEAYAEEQRIYKGKGNPVKTALNTQGYGGAYVQSSSAIPSAAVQAGPKGYEQAQRFLEASGNSRQVALAMRDKVLDPLRDKLMPDRTVNPSAFAKWQQDYAPAIRAIEEVAPGLRQQMSNASRATEALMEVGVRRAAFRQQFMKSAAAKFMKVSTPEEAQKVIGDMISAKDGPTQIRNLIRQANGDRAIIDGLQENAIQWISGKVSNISEMGTSKVKVMSNSGMTKMLNENGAALKELFDNRPDIYSNLFAIRDRLNQNQRMVAATNVKGSPGTAKDLIKSGALEHGSSHEGAWVLAGNHLLEHGITPHAAAVGVGAGIAAYVKKVIMSGREKTQDTLAEALRHPEYGKELMRAVPPKTPVSASILRGIRRAAILGPRQGQ